MRKIVGVVVILGTCLLMGCGAKQMNEDSEISSELTEVTEVTESSEVDSQVIPETENLSESEKETETESVTEDAGETTGGTTTDVTDDGTFDREAEIMADDPLEEILDWVLFSKFVDDDVEITLNNSEEFSFVSDRFWYRRPAANGSDFCYGLTIEKSTNHIKYITEYIPTLQDLLDIVQDGDYKVEYGEFYAMTKEQILEYIKKVYSEDTWGSYYSNFYVDANGIYVISGGTYTNYSTIRISRERLKEITSKPSANPLKNKLFSSTDEISSSFERYELDVPNTNDVVKVVYQTNNLISITFERPYYKAGTDELYYLLNGMTISKTTGAVTYINDYIPTLNDLIQKIEAGKYTAVSGKFTYMSQNEIVSYVKEYFHPTKWEMDGSFGYYSNYYITEDSVYIVINHVHEEYSVIRVDR